MRFAAEGREVKLLLLLFLPSSPGGSSSGETKNCPIKADDKSPAAISWRSGSATDDTSTFSGSSSARDVRQNITRYKPTRRVGQSGVVVRYFDTSAELLRTSTDCSRPSCTQQVRLFLCFCLNVINQSMVNTAEKRDNCLSLHKIVLLAAPPPPPPR